MVTWLGYFPTNSQVERSPTSRPSSSSTGHIKDLKTADWKYIVTVYDECSPAGKRKS